MAGSLIVTSYETDDEIDFNVRLDETNVKLTGFGFILGANTEATAQRRRIKPADRRPITMRYVIVAGFDEDFRIVRRKLYVHSPLATAWTNPTSIDFTDRIPDYSTNGGNWLVGVRITALIGEKRYLLGANDSGIIDGTIGNA